MFLSKLVLAITCNQIICGVTVIVVGNGDSDPSSYPKRDGFYFT